MMLADGVNKVGELSVSVSEPSSSSILGDERLSSVDA